MNKPQTDIVNVNELTYKPEIAIDVLKYIKIRYIIPTILKRVLIPIVAIIRI